MENTTLVAYYRVSTSKQGESGLGLEAQRNAVQGYSRMTGMPVIAEFEEIESGKRNRRPILTEALKRARGTHSTLIIAKLDRLSRNVAFLARLMESKTNFVCCDNPHASHLTLHIMASIAQYEREMISKRTKEALAAYKARGGHLGGRPGHPGPPVSARLKGVQIAGEMRGERFREFYKPLWDRMRDLGEVKDVFALEKLRAEGFKTAQGKELYIELLGRVRAAFGAKRKRSQSISQPPQERILETQDTPEWEYPEVQNPILS